MLAACSVDKEIIVCEKITAATTTAIGGIAGNPKFQSIIPFNQIK